MPHAAPRFSSASGRAPVHAPGRVMRLAAALGALALGAAALAKPPAPPETPVKPVSDTYHGTTVTDNYRWLEDWSGPEVQKWSAEQNTYARSILDHLPNREAISSRVAGILQATSVSFFDLHRVPGAMLGLMRQPPKQQPLLVAWDQPEKLLDGSFDAAKGARVVLDPGVLDPTGKTSMDWFVPSPDGSMVAVSLSKGGSESGDVYIFSVTSGQRVYEIIPRVNGGTAGGSLCWSPDSKSFFYTRYPREGERPKEDLDFYMQVAFHMLGRDLAEDRIELGTDFPRIAEIILESHTVPERNGKASPHNGAVLASVQKGDGGEFMHWLRKGDGTWTQLTRYEDRVVQASFGPDDALYMISRKDAPRGKLLRLSLDTPTLASAKVIVPEGKDALVNEFDHANNLLITDSRVYAMYQLGGPSEVRVFGHDGAALPRPEQLPVSAVGGLARFKGDAVLFANVSYTKPPAWYFVDELKGAKGKDAPAKEGAAGKEGAAPAPPAPPARKTALATTSPVSFDEYEAVREFATSKDGTKIPVNIIRKKGLALDGSHPCWVYAYGGYGVNTEPGFSAARITLLEQGLVLGIANIRGGGEFGEDWHTQGNLTKKQNVFDDFAAACKHMIDRKYTTSEKLAIEGGSNGGLLMGATLTQHPELMRCVVSHVGIYDMLRVELSSNGAFNVTEFGTVKDRAQFEALYAYSPLHNVKKGAAYPAVLFLTGANDPRVDPMQSRKMTAALQAATSGDPERSPIMLRTSMDSGHGIGTPLKERIAQAVDVNAFLFHMLGVEYVPVSGK